VAVCKDNFTRGQGVAREALAEGASLADDGMGCNATALPTKAINSKVRLRAGFQ